jgi:5'-deoxynucleotidase YfbR-like HD superfamily hydrolase
MTTQPNDKVEAVEEATDGEFTEAVAAIAALKLECLKYAKNVTKENIENMWATKKQLPREVSIDELIEEADKLWRFMVSN